MERKILFRGKTQYGEWFEGSYLQTDDNTNNPMQHRPLNLRHQIWSYWSGDWNMGGWSSMDVVPETVGQFTGLTDKNGKEIFEGDIIRFTRKQGYHTAETGAIHLVSYYSKSYTGYGINESSPLTMKKSNECEVISNIHDNPELIKTI
jgi:uncharacterized phage protein (TIGR01671 family)